MQITEKFYYLHRSTSKSDDANDVCVRYLIQTMRFVITILRWTIQFHVSMQTKLISFNYKEIVVLNLLFEIVCIFECINTVFFGCCTATRYRFLVVARPLETIFLVVVNGKHSFFLARCKPQNGWALRCGLNFHEFLMHFVSEKNNAQL